ncbi:ABC transporter substrate-binding protein [Pseudoalteromonas phenolica]|uniref:ABC transporter substrate-binding protein n=1 Tax=Pseudoalteromonas phenolica TaxID=161398 RepID=UPI00384D5AE5
MIRFFCFCIITFILNAQAIASELRPLNVMFLNPGHPSNNPTGYFWPNVNYFMQEAAEDLDINLTTIYANRNHILMKSFAKDVIKQKPDFAVLVNEKGVAIQLVEEITKHKIQVFMLLNDLSDEELSSLSAEQRQYYAGSLIPNNFDAGFSLAEQLHDSLITNKTAHGKVNVLALHGDTTSPASVARAEGLNSFLNSHPGVRLIDNTVANWSKQHAYEKVKGILKHQKVDIIWAANDAMACGATSAVASYNLLPTIRIGGINWDDDIPEGRLAVSVGGHVTLGAYAMVMIKELSKGKRQPERVEHSIFQHSNIKSYKAFMSALQQKRFNHCNFADFLSDSDTKRTFSIDNLICE